MAVIELFVDQFLAIDQGEPASNPYGQALAQTITFTDTAKNYLSSITVEQSFLMGQSAGLRRSVLYLSVTGYLPFYQSGGNGPDLQVLTQFLHIGQEARIVEFEAVSQTISIAQSVSVASAKNAATLIAFTDLASCTTVRSREVGQVLVVGSGGTGYLLREDTYSIVLPTLSGANTPEC